MILFLESERLVRVWLPRNMGLGEQIRIWRNGFFYFLFFNTYIRTRERSNPKRNKEKEEKKQLVWKLELHNIIDLSLISIGK